MFQVQISTFTGIQPLLVSDYILVIDTETSSLPKRWDKPYSDNANWPYALQVAWGVYTKAGEKVKEENFYISNDDFSIEPSSFAIHKLSKGFLRINGTDRVQVMKVLSADLLQYQPLVVGHFIELDFHVLGVEFGRCNMQNALSGATVFCTMIASEIFSENPAKKYLRLGELYEVLFSTPQEEQHNAIADVHATAACFFELEKRRVVTAQNKYAQPQPHIPVTKKFFSFFN